MKSARCQVRFCAESAIGAAVGRYPRVTSLKRTSRTYIGQAFRPPGIAWAGSSFGRIGLTVGGLGYSCSGLECSCTGDSDCNDMFTSNVCGDLAVCDEFGCRCLRV